MSKVEKSVEINKPVTQVYAQWTQFEEFPKFMESIEEVRQLDDKRLHWRAKVAGKQEEWEAEIVEQVPNQVIAWRSIGGRFNDGVVRFQPAGERTMVTAVIEYEAPGGPVGAVGDALLQQAASRVEGDLKRFKEFIETRQAPTGSWPGEIHGGQVKR